MPLNLKKARELCNNSEWQLVEACKRDEISTLSETQLKRHVARARKLRDKWRDQAVSQRRKTQQAQNARQTAANARSAEKAELFDEVLARFEKRLGKVASSSESAGSATTKKTPPRRVRSEEHRATRSTVRKKLASKRAKLDEQTVLDGPASSASSAAADRAAGSADAPISPTLKKKVKKVVKKGTKKAAQASKSAAKTGAAVKSTKLDRSGQRSAKAAAKAARLDKSGVNTRTLGHISASGKRSQARRDKR